MVAVVSTDRLSAVWSALLNAFLGRKAVKTVDACALYAGKVVKVNGGIVDVQLETADIASPSGIALLVAMPGALTLAGGESVLVGFRNGDPSQPYVFGMVQGTSAAEETIAATKLYLGAKSGAKPVGLNGDNCTVSVAMATWMTNVAAGILAGGGGMLAPLSGTTVATVTASATNVEAK